MMVVVTKNWLMTAAAAENRVTFLSRVIIMCQRRLDNAMAEAKGERMANLTRLSRFLSLILRHRAADFGLTLDEQGFTDVEAVWTVIAARFKGEYTRADLTALLAVDARQHRRFEQVDDRIRALYGHSKVKPVIYPAVVPPEVLYHGTHARAIPAIRRQGLRAMKRQYVHLSTTEARALEVAGRRATAPVLLVVRALDAHQDGIVFHHPEALHYLVQAVPVQFIEFPMD
jgi:putative RNA 2'-phosphotransferase